MMSEGSHRVDQHRTVSHVLAYLSEHYNKARKNKPVAIFIDLEKAFELANRLVVTEILIKGS